MLRECISKHSFIPAEGLDEAIFLKLVRTYRKPLEKKLKKNIMEKKIFEENVYYTIYWSPSIECDRHTVTGIPVLPGIVSLFQKNESLLKSLLVYGCWKTGIRIGLRNLLDPHFTQFPALLKYSDEKNLYFRYTVIDSHSLDMKDIMYWLIKEYEPELNNTKDFSDSERYKDIFLNEKLVTKDL